MNAKVKTGVTVILVFALCAAVLCAVNAAAGKRAPESETRMKETVLKALLPDADTFEQDEETGVLTVLDAQGNVVGYAALINSKGFDSEIETVVACAADGTISGIQVGGERFAESQGLGARVREDAFKAQFIGKSAPIAYGDGEGEVEAISAATITSNAVLRAVNDAAAKISAFIKPDVQEETGSAASGEATGSGQGLMGPVAVKITVENGAITAIEVGDEQFAETPGLGAKALEDEFKNQFIGKTLPMQLEDIDAISGATITSQAVVDAVNAAYAGIQ